MKQLKIRQLMAFSKLKTLTFTLFLLSILLTAAQSHRVHDILESNGLPRGIVPDAISSYALDNYGQLSIRLKQSTCYVAFPTSQLSEAIWNDPVTANISYGKMEGVRGMVARAGPTVYDLFSVTKIASNAGSIEFWAGSKLMATVPPAPFQKEKPCTGVAVAVAEV